MSTRNERMTVRGVFARAFGGEGGVIEPSQKTIIIAVLLGMGVGAVFTKPAQQDFKQTVAATTASPAMEVEFTPVD